MPVSLMQKGKTVFVLKILFHCRASLAVFPDGPVEVKHWDDYVFT